MQNDGAAEVSLERTFTVDNELGLHLRAAGKFAQTAGRFASAVWVKKDAVEVNAKSIMGILSLAAARGSCLHVRCAGADADKAMEAIATLFEKKFHET
jgi:phosphocarrier protein HPr